MAKAVKLTRAELAARDILDTVNAEFNRINDPGMSDLDNEQPVAMSLHFKLGDLRALSFKISDLVNRSRSSG